VAFKAKLSPTANPLPIPAPFPKIIVSPHASPGRIDFLNLKHWYRIETKPEDYYEVNQNTFTLRLQSPYTSSEGSRVGTLVNVGPLVRNKGSARNP
jgi:hypothetical protein